MEQSSWEIHLLVHYQVVILPDDDPELMPPKGTHFPKMRES